MSISRPLLYPESVIIDTLYTPYPYIFPLVSTTNHHLSVPMEEQPVSTSDIPDQLPPQVSAMPELESLIESKTQSPSNGNSQSGSPENPRSNRNVLSQRPPLHLRFDAADSNPMNPSAPTNDPNAVNAPVPNEYVMGLMDGIIENGENGINGINGINGMNGINPVNPPSNPLIQPPIIHENTVPDSTPINPEVAMPISMNPINPNDSQFVPLVPPVVTLPTIQPLPAPLPLPNSMPVNQQQIPVSPTNVNPIGVIPEMTESTIPIPVPNYQKPQSQSPYETGSLSARSRSGSTSVAPTPNLSVSPNVDESSSNINQSVTVSSNDGVAGNTDSTTNGMNAGTTTASAVSDGATNSLNESTNDSATDVLQETIPLPANPVGGVALHIQPNGVPNLPNGSPIPLPIAVGAVNAVNTVNANGVNGVTPITMMQYPQVPITGMSGMYPMNNQLNGYHPNTGYGPTGYLPFAPHMPLPAQFGIPQVPQYVNGIHVSQSALWRSCYNLPQNPEYPMLPAAGAPIEVQLFENVLNGVYKTRAQYGWTQDNANPPPRTAETQPVIMKCLNANNMITNSLLNNTLNINGVSGVPMYGLDGTQTQTNPNYNSTTTSPQAVGSRRASVQSVGASIGSAGAVGTIGTIGAVQGQQPLSSLPGSPGVPSVHSAHSQHVTLPHVQPVQTVQSLAVAAQPSYAHSPHDRYGSAVDPDEEWHSNQTPQSRRQNGQSTFRAHSDSKRHGNRHHRHHQNHSNQDYRDRDYNNKRDYNRNRNGNDRDYNYNHRGNRGNHQFDQRDGSQHDNSHRGNLNRNRSRSFESEEDSTSYHNRNDSNRNRKRHGSQHSNGRDRTVTDGHWGYNDTPPAPRDHYQKHNPNRRHSGNRTRGQRNRSLPLPEFSDRDNQYSSAQQQQQQQAEPSANTPHSAQRHERNTPRNDHVDAHGHRWAQAAPAAPVAPQAVNVNVERAIEGDEGDKTPHTPIPPNPVHSGPHSGPHSVTPSQSVPASPAKQVQQHPVSTPVDHDVPPASFAAAAQRRTPKRARPPLKRKPLSSMSTFSKAPNHGPITPMRMASPNVSHIQTYVPSPSQSIPSNQINQVPVASVTTVAPPAPVGAIDGAPSMPMVNANGNAMNVLQGVPRQQPQQMPSYQQKVQQPSLPLNPSAVNAQQMAPTVTEAIATGLSAMTVQPSLPTVNPLNDGRDHYPNNNAFNQGNDGRDNMMPDERGDDKSNVMNHQNVNEQPLNPLNVISSSPSPDDPQEFAPNPVNHQLQNVQNVNHSKISRSPMHRVEEPTETQMPKSVGSGWGQKSFIQRLMDSSKSADDTQSLKIRTVNKTSPKKLPLRNGKMDTSSAGNQFDKKHKQKGMKLDKAQQTCFHCGGVGHFKNECPTVPKGAGGGGRDAGAHPHSSQGLKKCFECGAVGHLANVCPSPLKRGRGHSSSNQSANNSSSNLLDGNAPHSSKQKQFKPRNRSQDHRRNQANQNGMDSKQQHQGDNPNKRRHDHNRGHNTKNRGSRNSQHEHAQHGHGAHGNFGHQNRGRRGHSGGRGHHQGNVHNARNSGSNELVNHNRQSYFAQKREQVYQSPRSSGPQSAIFAGADRSASTSGNELGYEERQKQPNQRRNRRFQDQRNNNNRGRGSGHGQQREMTMNPDGSGNYNNARNYNNNGKRNRRNSKKWNKHGPNAQNGEHAQHDQSGQNEQDGNFGKFNHNGYHNNGHGHGQRNRDRRGGGHGGKNGKKKGGGGNRGKFHQHNAGYTRKNKSAAPQPQEQQGTS